MSRRNFYLLLAAIGVSLICYQRSDSAHRGRYGRMFSTYCRVMQAIEDNFIEEVEPRKVFDAGLAGMTDALDDPYAKYIPAEDYSGFQQELAQEFGDRDQQDGHWDFMLEGQKGIAYIRVLKFGEKTVAELKEALEKISDQGFKGLVLDLRYNPGGLLKEAVEVCDLFVDEGVIVS